MELVRNTKILWARCRCMGSQEIKADERFNYCQKINAWQTNNSKSCCEWAEPQGWCTVIVLYLAKLSALKDEVIDVKHLPGPFMLFRFGSRPMMTNLNTAIKGLLLDHDPHQRATSMVDMFAVGAPWHDPHMRVMATVEKMWCVVGAPWLWPHVRATSTVETCFVGTKIATSDSHERVTPMFSSLTTILTQGPLPQWSCVSLVLELLQLTPTRGSLLWCSLMSFSCHHELLPTCSNQQCHFMKVAKRLIRGNGIQIQPSWSSMHHK